MSAPGSFSPLGAWRPRLHDHTPRSQDETPAIETHDDLEMVSLPHVDLDAAVESAGSIRGILTGVLGGGLIWLGVLAYLVL